MAQVSLSTTANFTNATFQFPEAEKLRLRLPVSLHRLADLAYNYWWSWHSQAVALFATLDPIGWDRYAHNPVILLESIGFDRLTQMTCDVQYMENYGRSHLGQTKPEY
jgi:glycogen phosphorylase